MPGAWAWLPGQRNIAPGMESQKQKHVGGPEAGLVGLHRKGMLAGQPVTAPRNELTLRGVGRGRSPGVRTQTPSMFISLQAGRSLLHSVWAGRSRLGQESPQAALWLAGLGKSNSWAPHLERLRRLSLWPLRLQPFPPGSSAASRSHGTSANQNLPPSASLGRAGRASGPQMVKWTSL